MRIFKASSIAILAAIILIGCSGPEPAKLGPKQAWKKGDYLKDKQIVFTNQYQFKDGRYAIGAGSFLVQGKSGPVLCTAKHLLSDAMGITPKVATSDFDTKIDFWKVYAKNDALFEDTLIVSRMLTKKPDVSDIILLSCTSTKGDNLLPLKPRFTRIGVDEELEIIGYEYGDSTGNQSSFKVTYDEYDNETLIVKSKSIFKAIGMSGSPVVDASGYVVGVLVGGGIFEGKMYLTVEPLSRVKKYLR
ncbi:trypsin-like peptidase domain-containing protein [Crocinitomicaceae bacterium]|nr:trypsin-like peptidase domain-containing protein [Crocinitomicaceae bacterium]MDB3906230.1 trypsin-like peptidase domain-containing protein [Crocinitomicaceae bacterium]